MLLIAKQCLAYVEQYSLEFSFKGETITPEAIFSESGLLAAIAKRADANASVCLGYGIGAHYSIDDESLLGVKVDFDTTTPASIRLAFVIDILHELAHSAANVDGIIALDELLYE